MIHGEIFREQIMDIGGIVLLIVLMCVVGCGQEQA